MNFYKHHLGDYAAATVHLTWDEDCAYRRLIDQYYKREAPLPAEAREVCRLARATTPAQRKAVETVLRDFFELREDGWHQKRCDQEIAEAAEQGDERSAKHDNERERQRRHRAERKKLFQQLREQDVVPAWDTKTDALRSMLEYATVTHLKRDQSRIGDAPVTRTATAIHNPDSISQTPDSRNTESGSSPPSSARVSDGPPEPEPPRSPAPPPAEVAPSAAGIACRGIKAAGIADVNPGHPGLQRLLEGGVTAADLAATAAELVAKGKPKFLLLLATQEGRLRDAAAAGAVPATAGPPPGDDWTTRRGVEAIAANHGLPHWDECISFDAYRATIRRHVDAATTQPKDEAA